MPLDSLPTELQCAIYRLLDPISLIAISQTNARLRALIDPQAGHFVERLLALETHPQYGGPLLSFRARDNRLTPEYSKSRWSPMRWACCRCMRLLPHTSFDNHAILQLAYRKPLADSPSVPRPLTSWEPTPARSWKRDNEDERDDRAPKTGLGRLRYHLCITRGAGPDGGNSMSSAERLEQYVICGMTEFENMTLEEFVNLDDSERMRIFDANARVIEIERCGSKRKLRRCLECRYQRGQLTLPLNRGRGSDNFPIVPSRSVNFDMKLDR